MSNIGKLAIAVNRSFGPISWLGRDRTNSVDKVYGEDKKVVYIVASKPYKDEIYDKIINVFVPSIGKVMFLYEHEVIDDLTNNTESSDE